MYKNEALKNMVLWLSAVEQGTPMTTKPVIEVDGKDVPVVYNPHFRYKVITLSNARSIVINPARWLVAVVENFNGPEKLMNTTEAIHFQRKTGVRFKDHRFVHTIGKELLSLLETITDSKTVNDLLNIKDNSGKLVYQFTSLITQVLNGENPDITKEYFLAEIYVDKMIELLDKHPNKEKIIRKWFITESTDV